VSTRLRNRPSASIEENPDPVVALVTRRRAEAERLRIYGADPQALTLEACAKELQEVLRAAALECLTLNRAAKETGLSYSALEKAVRQGRLPNAGRKGKPLVLRKDLPRKAASHLHHRDPDLADRVLARRGHV
jgi:hypothetical protein